MKKGYIVLLVAAGILVSVLLGIFLFRHFVTDQVTDKGGMENPFLEEEAASEYEAESSVETVSDLRPEQASPSDLS